MPPVPSKDKDKEVRSLTGNVLPEELAALRDGPFTRYMQRIYQRTNVSDPAYVIRRLYHWTRTTATVKNQSANARMRFGALLREQEEAAAELEHARSSTLVELPVDASGDGARVAQLQVQPQQQQQQMPVGQASSRLDALARANSRKFDAGRMLEKRVQLLLDMSAVLGNLGDRLEQCAPALARKARSEISEMKRLTGSGVSGDALWGEACDLGQGSLVEQESNHVEEAGGAAEAETGTAAGAELVAVEESGEEEEEEEEGVLGMLAGARSSMTLEDLDEQLPSRLGMCKLVLDAMATQLGGLPSAQSLEEQSTPLTPAWSFDVEGATKPPPRVGANAPMTGPPRPPPRPSSAGPTCGRLSASASVPLMSKGHPSMANLDPSFSRHPEQHSPHNNRVFKELFALDGGRRPGVPLDDEDIVTADEACVNVARRGRPRAGAASASHGRVGLGLRCGVPPPRRPVGAGFMEREERKQDSASLVKLELERREREALAKEWERRNRPPTLSSSPSKL